MGTLFSGNNKTNMKVYKEQIHVCGHKLCNKMGGGQSVKDKYCSNNNNFFIWMHFY
jgi:hypothetical protein